MARNETESMFRTDRIDPSIMGAMGITVGSQAAKNAMTANIMNIFQKAKDNNKKELSLSEITIAYYNLYTSEEKDEKLIKNKNDIAVKLYHLRKMNLIESVPMTRGLYRLKEDTKNQ